jgi:hypothetical protein
VRIAASKFLSTARREGTNGVGRGTGIALNSLTSALEGMGGQIHVPAALTQ